MARPPFDPNKVSPEPEPLPTGDALLTVTQLTFLVKRALEQYLPPTVRVIGQISNFKRHTSGHLYFVLKDDHCELSCVMWRSAAANMKFKPTDGLEILATGQVDVFERSGRYQLYVRKLEPRGVGALELAFRQMREKLQKEGLFDAQRKRPLPRFPQRLAVVTSLSGAAVRDIIQTLKRRYPCVHVYVYPVTVQGPTAAPEIVQALRMLNRHDATIGPIDAIILGRGGGSLEDLWAFNEEIVARAVHASDIPIISAVGHETDISITDLVADVRAATPTAAAELAVPVRDELLHSLSDTARRLTRMTTDSLTIRRARVTAVLQRPTFRRPLQTVRTREQSLDEIASRLAAAVSRRLHLWHRLLAAVELTLQRIRPGALASTLHRRVDHTAHRLRWAVSRAAIKDERRLAAACERFASASPKHRLDPMIERLNQLAKRCDAMSHRNTLKRGFTITRSEKPRGIVRHASDVRDGQTVVTETADGEFRSRVFNVMQMELFE